MGGGHFGGSSHMSIGHSGGSSHMSMGSFFGGHSLSSGSSRGSLSSIGSPSHSWHFSTSNFNSEPAVHHGFAHGLARLFGFSSPVRAGSQLPAMTARQGVIASNLTPSATINLATLRAIPICAYLRPYLRAYNPYFNAHARRYYPYLSWWYPYMGSYWGTAFPYNFYSPWFLPDYYPLLFFSYLDPEYYVSFCPSMYFPYTTAFGDSSPLDPYFIPGDDYVYNTPYDAQAFSPMNDGWSPPTYDPSSGVVDPELVPFDLSLPVK
jgi:hypothetical protein